MKCRANGEQIRIKSQNQNSDYCLSLLFNTLLRFGGWADQSVGNWHQRKQIIGEHAPVQRSGKRRFKRSERDGKKERTKQSRDEGGIGCKKLDWKLWECAQINVCTHCTMCCTNHGACSHCEAKTHKSAAQNFAETLTICGRKRRQGLGKREGGEIAFGTDDALKTERKLQTLL